MAGISDGPINSLPGAGFRPTEVECDDCSMQLCNELAKRAAEGSVPWHEVPGLKAEYDRRKVDLPRATVRVQGETDSFGCEFIDLCKECAEKHYKAVREYRELERSCDWCRKLGKLAPTRDYDEGSHGPVYEVCEPCWERQFVALQEELDFYDSWCLED